MGRTTNRKAPASATDPKTQPKKPSVKSLKKSIELVKREEETKGSSQSSQATGAEATVKVDSHVVGGGAFEVVYHEGKPLSIYLNWSDLKANHNKFYIV